MTRRALRFKHDTLIRGPIEVRPSPIHRYGVFATQDIPVETIVEECPLIALPTISNPDGLTNFVFQSSEDDNQVFLVLGWGSIYNHSDQNNIQYYYDDSTDLMFFVTTRDVQAGEELCVSYGEEWFKTREG